MSSTVISYVHPSSHKIMLRHKRHVTCSYSIISMYLAVDADHSVTNIAMIRNFLERQLRLVTIESLELAETFKRSNLLVDMSIAAVCSQTKISFKHGM